MKKGLKTIILMVMFLLVFPIGFGLETETVFNETFGTGNQYIIGEDTCLNKANTNTSKYIYEGLTSFSYTNYDYVCALSLSGARFFLNETTNYDKTNVFNLSYSGQLSGYAGMELIYLLPETARIHNETILEYSIFDAMCISFTTETGQDIQLASGYCGVNTNDFGNPDYNCGSDYYNITSLDNGFNLFRYNFSEIVTSCGVPSALLRNITHLRIYTINPTGTNANDIGQEIEYISFNYLNGTNEIPEINLTLSNFTYCLNQTLIDNYVDVEFNYSVSDAENDTIYFGRLLNIVSNQSTIYDFTDNSIFGIVNTDTSFLNDVVDNSAYCDFNLTNLNNEISLFNTLDENGNSVYMLDFDARCTNPSQMDFIIPDYNRFEIVGDIYFNDNLNESYSIFIYDNSYTEMFNITIIVNSTNVSKKDVYYNGVLQGTYNKTGTYKFWLEMNSKTDDTIDFSLVKGTNILRLDDLVIDNNNNSTQPKYFGFRANNGIVDINRLYFLGSYDVFTWDTELNTTVRIYDTGNFPIKVFVTDNIHLADNQYNSDTVYFNVVDIDYCIGVSQDLEDAGKIIKGSFAKICSATNNFNTNGFYFDWCNIMVIGVTILSFVIALIITAIFVFFGMNGVSVFMLSYSSFMIMGQIFIIDLPRWYVISIGIVFVLGLISFFLNIFSTGVSSDG